MKPISKMFFITFCILLLISSIGKGQVKIKERLEISPTNGKLISRSVQSFSEFKISVAWNPLYIAIIKVSDSANNLVREEAGGGYSELAITNPVGPYCYYNVQFMTIIGSTACSSATINFYLDGIQLNTINDSFCSMYGQYELKWPECPEIPECAILPSTTPHFISSVYTNAELNQVPCDLSNGGTQDQYGEFAPTTRMEDFEIAPCYNIYLNQWVFPVEGMTIGLKTIIDICEQNITDADKELIKNIMDLPCSAVSDLAGHAGQIGIKSAEYIIEPLVILHENEHRKQYEKFFNENYIDNLKDKLEDYRKTCWAMDYEEAKEKGANDIKVIIWDYFDKVRKFYNDNYKARKEQIEKDIQTGNVMTNAVNYYQSLLERIKCSN